MAKDPVIKTPKVRVPKAPRIKKSETPAMKEATASWKQSMPLGQGTEEWRAWGLAKPTRVHANAAHLARKTPLKPSTGASIGAQWRNYGLARLNKSKSGKIVNEAAQEARKNSAGTTEGTGESTSG